MGQCHSKKNDTINDEDITDYDILKLQLKQQIQKLNTQLQRSEVDSKKLREQAKQAIRDGNKQLAQHHLTLQKMCCSQQQQLMNQITSLQQNYNQLKSVENMKAIKETIAKCNKWMSETNLENLQDELQEVMATSKEQDMQVQHLNELMAQFGITDQDIDEEFNMLQDELLAEKVIDNPIDVQKVQNVTKQQEKQAQLQ